MYMSNNLSVIISDLVTYFTKCIWVFLCLRYTQLEAHICFTHYMGICPHSKCEY